ncbi:hypothetical protein LCGC14_1625220 [marine sediment metagenome]|uniref:Uncharacterized protein n=1 Tax=marine sediment metagenome TaxID=412755 RepID=A0A0F9L3Y4_9ZZZZ
MLKLTKQNLELIIIKSNPIEYHPSIALDLCREFGLNWERIQEMWLYKRNPKLFEEKLKEYYK